MNKIQLYKAKSYKNNHNNEEIRQINSKLDYITSLINNMLSKMNNRL